MNADELTTGLLTSAGPLMLMLWRLERAADTARRLLSELELSLKDHAARLDRLEDAQK